MKTYCTSMDVAKVTSQPSNACGVFQPACLTARAAGAGPGLKKTSGMQSVHHKDNVTLSTGLSKIYHTHSWLFIEHTSVP